MKFYDRLLRGAIAALFLLAFAPVHAEVFYSKEEAMELAFGKGKTVEMLSLFPDDKQFAKIQELAKAKLEPGMFTFYVGKDSGKILGYAAIESTTVRTNPETLMIVLSPEGELSQVHTLAFHEPSEYMAPEDWFKQLYKRPLAEMDFNAGVDGISGATLSTRAGLNSVRKVMALYQIMIQEPKP